MMIISPTVPEPERPPPEPGRRPSPSTQRTHPRARSCVNALTATRMLDPAMIKAAISGRSTMTELRLEHSGRDRQ